MQILQWPDERLARVAEEVIEVTDGVRTIASAMLATMREHRGVGLAAPQVGVGLRVIVGEGPGWTFALVNPRIVKRSPYTAPLMEGCLSFASKGTIKVHRPKLITIEALNLRGEPIKRKAHGLMAAVLQHEIDHLDGITLHDKGLA